MWAVVITRHEGREPVAVGPFRGQAIADGLATSCNNFFESDYPGCAASVVSLLPSITSTRDVLEEAM